jgi:cytochrome bd-type quinol oxidase subunit 1
MGVSQHYLFEARQMQALSLAVHIPLVCFGIAFPVLVLFAEYRYLRTGDDLYRVLARRWSRIMLALLAVGVVTGTILSFELGLLWPVWMQDFGNVFGLGITMAAASVAAPLQVIIGDWAARDVAAYQPVKLAALEGLAHTTKGAAEHLLGCYTLPTSPRSPAALPSRRPLPPPRRAYLPRGTPLP